MKIVVYSPYSGIWRHTVLETQVMSAMKEFNDIEIIRISCGGVFQSGCTTRRYFGIEEPNSDTKLKEACSKCIKLDHLSAGTITAKIERLSEYLEPVDFEKARDFVNDCIEEDPEKIKLEDIPIGKFALYELILRHKKRNLNFSEQQTMQLASELENCFLTAIGTKRILERIKPDVIIIFNPQYSSPRTFAEVAIKYGIKTYYLSGSGSPREIATTIRIWNWEKYKLVDPALSHWKSEMAQKNLKWLDRRRAEAHFGYIKASISPWSYSPAPRNEDPFERFSIDRKNKLILVVLNSSDEVLAAKTSETLPVERFSSQVFPDQKAWIEFLVGFYAERDDVSVIIRLHPREFPNKRELQIAEHADAWSLILQKLPSNFRIDSPEVNFPLSDYFPHISLVTTGWSTVAIESLFNEISVVTYDESLLGYPSDLVITGSSVDEYRANLNSAENLLVKDGLKLAALNWIKFAYFDGGVRLGGGLQDLHLRYQTNLAVFFARLCNRIANQVAPRRVKDFDIRIPRMNSDDYKLERILMNLEDDLYE